MKKILKTPCLNWYIIVLLMFLVPFFGKAQDACQRDFHEWYVPNGVATYNNTIPETRAYDVTGYSQEWIHILNISPKEANVTLTFYTESAPPRDTSYTIPAGNGRPLNIYDGKIPSMIKINQLYGIRVKSDVDVMVQVTRHESETGQRIPSNHLQSNIGYPGPLGKKETRWLYVDCWSLTDDPQWIEKEWLNLLNPSKEEAQLKLTFIDRWTGKQTHTTTAIPAERIFTLNLVTLPPEIYHQHTAFSVLVESNVPVVTMQIRRFFHADNQSPRGMIGMLAYPIGDRDNLK